MSTYFQRAEDARDHGLAAARVDPTTIELVEDSTLQVSSAAGFLSDPTTLEGRERIEKDVQGQKGYRFKNGNGVELAIVVAPFRDGYCVWGVSPNGYAIRL